MAHIFFIDPLEKLNIRKDSTLMMALTFLREGIECYLMFEEDFYITNDKESNLAVYNFDGVFAPEGFYLGDIMLGEKITHSLSKSDIIHMRIDPPYDTRYQRYLWMLDFLEQKTHCEVLNNPLKIMKYNEKLVAYRDLSHSHHSYIGSSLSGFQTFIEKLKSLKHKEIILKPLDLYSGIGVEKVAIDSHDLIQKFEQKVKDFHGAIVCQPFIEDVYKGEYRSIYFDGEELGTIIKKPKSGEYLANIAQGAAFEKVELPVKLKEVCNKIAQELYQDNVRFIAFDLLGGAVNEINVTCPGLLVEVSYACKENLCHIIASKF